MAKKKTTAPSGLKITRNGNKMICEWTTHSYESQTFQINVNNAKYPKAQKGHKKGDLIWHTLSVGKNTHSKTINTGTDKYQDGKKATIPRITKGFRFRVKAKTKGATGCGFESKSYQAEKMGQPTFILPELWNGTLDTYSYRWTQHPNDGARSSSKKMFEKFYWETVLMPKGKAANWNLAKSQKITIVNGSSHIPWPDQDSYGTTTAAAPEILIVEKNEDIAARKVRYFRIFAKARNSKFDSDDRSYSHQLGAPDQVKFTPDVITFKSSSIEGTTATIKLGRTELGTNTLPNVSCEIQYAITPPYVSASTASWRYPGVPTTSNEPAANWITDEQKNQHIGELYLDTNSGIMYRWAFENEIYDWVLENDDYVRSSMSLPSGFNNWTTDLNGKFIGASIPDTYAFRTTDQLTNDTCLFIRVNRTYDERTSYGVPVLVNTIYSLSDPTLTFVSINPNTKEVTVTVQNNTQLADGGNKSFIAVYCRSESNKNPEKPIGIIPYSNSETVATFQADWLDSEASSVGIGIRAFVADYTPINRSSSGVTTYTLANIKMQSSGIIWEDNAVPLPPQNVKVDKDSPGVALVTWDWNWAEADSVEISWSEDEIIWESTETPSSYVVSNTRLGKRYITGLSATTYYVRVRFMRTVGDVTTYGTYSDIVKVTMSSAPSIPVLQLVPDGVVSIDDEISAYWQFNSTDGTPQLSAELAEAFDNDGTWEYEQDSSKWLTASLEKKTFTPREMGWEEGSTHYICVRVTSTSLKTSDGWSNPRIINVASKPIISVSGIGGENDPLRPDTIILDDDTSYTYPLALKTLPLTCVVTGVETGGFVTVTIERSQNYSLNQPDDSISQGYEQETIFSNTFQNVSEEAGDEVSVRILASDLQGQLDNNANYRLLLSVTDSYGQTVPADPYEFTVRWDRAAEKPTAIINLYPDLDICTIQPIAPNTATEDDRCDIYRLSADRPMLIKGNAIFGETYVDEHPTLGVFGGYRIVHVTEYGDYTTEDRDFAWTDYSPYEDDEYYIPSYNKFAVIIEFEDRKVEFIGDVSVSHAWAKDFQSTVYLGGSVEGDWNADIVRTGSINSTVPVEEDPDTAYDMHLLADYAGICHVRTPDGANFYADVQAKDSREEKWVRKLSKVSLSYTTVDYEVDDVLTETEWEEEQRES